MLDYKAIGRRIAFYRKKADLTQAVLAEQLGISDGYISQIECGAAKVSLARLDKIAEILGVDMVLLVSDQIGATDHTVNSEIFEIVKGWDKKRVDLLIALLTCADNHLQ